MASIAAVADPGTRDGAGNAPGFGTGVDTVPDAAGASRRGFLPSGCAALPNSSGERFRPRGFSAPPAGFSIFLLEKSPKGNEGDGRGGKKEITKPREHDENSTSVIKSNTELSGRRQGQQSELNAATESVL